jgi:Peptidase MA superfamily
MKSLGLMRFMTASVIAALFAAALAPTIALASGPTFGQPSVTAELGQPLTFSSTIDGSDIASVDVIIHLLGNPTSIVVNAGTQINNIYEAQANIDISASAGCACLATGQSAPNTQFDYQFQVTNSDGGTSVGPVAQAVVQDTRFTWQTLTKGNVVIHWYAGDQAFANSAADEANAAIDKASQALGVTIDKPFDMFVYDTEDAMRSAVNPGRENVQAEAHPDIDTIFAWLPSNQPADPYNQTVIAHELTHLVFHHAIDNPYAGVPRWLDEGVAVYESEGYTAQWKSYVDAAVADKSLIPLDGLAGLFPSVQSEFYLAYGESVAAVDFFIRTYGEPKFWELVKSYAAGVSDDEAFTAATGSDVEAFNAAWFSSLGLTPPSPAGPQPGVPGPVPSDWTGGAGAPATLSPPVTPGITPPPSGATRETARPLGSAGATAAPAGSAGNGGSGATDVTQTLLVLGLVVVLIIGTIGVALAVRSRSDSPPGSSPY